MLGRDEQIIDNQTLDAMVFSLSGRFLHSYATLARDVNPCNKIEQAVSHVGGESFVAGLRRTLSHLRDEMRPREVKRGDQVQLATATPAALARLSDQWPNVPACAICGSALRTLWQAPRPRYLQLPTLACWAGEGASQVREDSS
jgi:hypothetical protein